MSKRGYPLTKTMRIERRAAALARGTANARAPEQQLRELDVRLGDGTGATKERARLQAKVGEAKEKAG